LLGGLLRALLRALLRQKGGESKIKKGDVRGRLVSRTSGSSCPRLLVALPPPHSGPRGAPPLLHPPSPCRPARNTGAAIPRSAWRATRVHPGGGPGRPRRRSRRGRPEGFSSLSQEGGPLSGDGVDRLPNNADPLPRLTAKLTAERIGRFSPAVDAGGIVTPPTSIDRLFWTIADRPTKTGGQVEGRPQPRLASSPGIRQESVRHALH
jgi:hypothetical protein